jgi:diguanylate cyclase (GGDEF)-like protein
MSNDEKRGDHADGKGAELYRDNFLRELAVNRISTAIRCSLELPSVLQTTVNEVGIALGAQYCVLTIEGLRGEPPLTTCYFRDGEADDATREELLSDVEAYGVRLRGRIEPYVHDGSSGAGGSNTKPVAAIPLIFHERTMGVLMVTSDEPERVWQDNEIILLHTVANQVAVAVNHARLFQQMQREALTDGLTGCFNRRFFEIQLERDLHLATRMRQPVSLILIDIDHFKRVNDTHGHGGGDEVLRLVSRRICEEMRGVDTAARYGGEEFAIVLPQAGPEGGLAVAEHIRVGIEKMDIPLVGSVTVSLGVAVFPLHASSRELLVEAADRALYQAKRTGRNRVCTPVDVTQK